MEELAGLLGRGDVTFYSQDDKAKVPIGHRAASKQAPLLMYMKYKITLLDLNYAIAPHHKLIMSVISDTCVQEKDFSGDIVTYSGPTYCAIQSAKHSGSKAYHHLQEMYTISWYIQWRFNNDSGNSKPVMIVTINGCPDENTRSKKTIQCAINYFTTQDLNAFFLSTNG